MASRSEFLVPGAIKPRCITSGCSNLASLSSDWLLDEEAVDGLCLVCRRAQAEPLGVTKSSAPTALRRLEEMRALDRLFPFSPNGPENEPALDDRAPIYLQGTWKSAGEVAPQSPPPWMVDLSTEEDVAPQDRTENKTPPWERGTRWDRQFQEELGTPGTAAPVRQKNQLPTPVAPPPEPTEEDLIEEAISGARRRLSGR